VTIEVSQCQSNADCDDGNACTTDVCNPSDPNSNSGGCVISNVECDACQVCDVDLGCTGPVCTPTATATSTVTNTPTLTGTPVPTNTPTNTPEPFCGDGNVDPGEICDDGNMFENDGCEPEPEGGGPGGCMPSTSCTLSYPGTERFVGGCGAPNHPDIQAAINAATDVDVITVCSGTYTQSVVVTKQVKIRAVAGGAVIVHTSGTAFDVRRSGVQIEGLTIQSDSGAAIAANSICPLGQTSCGSPGYGSNLKIVNNTIQGSPIGIGYQRRIDCAEITGNTMTNNAVHIELLQQEGPPAVLVTITENSISTGGQSGAAVSLSGLGVTFSANTIENSTNGGIVLANVPGNDATQVIENSIANNNGDGITVKPGAEGTEIHYNNITDNEIGLGNEATSGTLDATLNWWDSQSGPSGVFTGKGDGIVNRNSGTVTQFIEFLCKPFPQGFASIMGVCSTETPELKQLLPGHAPDLEPVGGNVAFESSANLHIDPRASASNADGSNEIFLINLRKSKKINGVCLGGLQPCDFANPSACPPCLASSECVGDPDADPIVLNGECVIVTQLTDGTAAEESSKPRVGTRSKHIAFRSNSNETGGNGDGSLEIASWSRRDFDDGVLPVSMMTHGVAPMMYDNPEPNFSNRYLFVESNDNPTGENGDGNIEIFAYRTRRDQWVQVTHTLPPVSNHRPATIRGRQIVFDSDGDLVGGNADGNREVFVARVRPSGVQISQITHTTAPVDNRSGSIDLRSKAIAFSSTGNFLNQNADGNREIFVWTLRDKTFEQITHSIGGENTNPCLNQNHRYLSFESTADLTNSGATNRRVFEYDRFRQELTLLSRSRFGDNVLPRSRRQFVVWESTADLTGHNASHQSMIYVFDRKKD
jgi:cysteine-rich repeat protein